MLRTQKDVDKHVQEVLRKITNEKEVRLVAGGSQYLQVGGLDAGFSLCWTFALVNRVASAFKICRTLRHNKRNRSPRSSDIS